jgi:hypothetical protein
MRILAALLALLLCLTAQSAEADESEAVRESFRTLQKALKEKNAAVAMEQLSEETKDYYLLLARAAKQFSGKELEKLSPLNQIMVALVRKKLPGVKSPEDLLPAAIQAGFVSRELSAEMELGEIKFSGNKAISEIKRSGKTSALKLFFTKENERWRVDLSALIDQANAMAEEYLKKTGIDGKAFSKGITDRIGVK